MTLACVVFDFDGTLVDSADVKRRTFYDVVSENPQLMPALDELLEQLPPLDRFEVFAQLAEHYAGAGEDAWEGLAEQWVSRYTELVERRVAAAGDIPGASKALQALSTRSVRVAVVSDTPEDSLRRAAAKRDWAVLVQEIHGRPTSKPQHLHGLMATLELGPEELVMIGDSDSDRLAAQTVGCHFVQVSREQSAGRLWPVVPDLLGLVRVLDELDEAEPVWSTIPRAVAGP